VPCLVNPVPLAAGGDARRRPRSSRSFNSCPRRASCIGNDPGSASPWGARWSCPTTECPTRRSRPASTRPGARPGGARAHLARRDFRHQRGREARDLL